jgi:hypothetical protein
MSEVVAVEVVDDFHLITVQAEIILAATMIHPVEQHL